jgi:tetratricopeptide (TPR) repeat protein
MISRLTVILIAASLAFGSAAAAQTDPHITVLPLTTKSAKAHRLLDQAWDLAVDQVEQVKAIRVLRKAVQTDPNFAMGHEILAQMSLDPSEQVSEQGKAFATKRKASLAEQTIVDWFQNAAEHKLIPAITNMNDVLGKYPQDRWVVYLASHWLTNQTQYDRAAAVYEHSGIADSPGLMNNTAYTYAYMRQFDKAFALMDKYIAALPKDANPQDSYAEIFRMAGHFDEAIEHYKAALAINPEFYSSQFGIADTYSLVGDQVRARQEYELAFRKFPLPELHRIQWKTREAITYVRDGDLKAANAAFQVIADYAHAKKMSQVEADTYRQMAMYQLHSQQALLFLAKAEDALREGNNVMPGVIQQEFAQILRARVELAIKIGDQQMADATLSELAELSDNSDDKLIETAYHGAAGALLFSGHDYKHAALHLEEDIHNPFSLKLLAVAYQKTGDSSEAKRTRDTLANLNDPTLEQAMIVPAFRKCIQNPSCDSSIKKASFQP